MAALVESGLLVLPQLDRNGSSANRIAARVENQAADRPILEPDLSERDVHR